MTGSFSSGPPEKMESPKRPLLLVIEGADGAGKSTQVELLAEYLRGTGRRVVLRRYPDRGNPVGRILDSYLKKEIDLPSRAVSLLFTADRYIQDSADQDADVIICDRYIPSGVVYAKTRNPERTWEELYLPENGLQHPDLVFYLHSPYGPEGGKTGEERGEDVDFQSEVQKNYHEFFEWVREGIWKSKIYFVARCEQDLVSGFIHGKTEIFLQKSNP